MPTITLLIVSSILLAACSSSSTATSPAKSESHLNPDSNPTAFFEQTPPPGTAIPSTTVSFGMRPVANDDIFEVAIKEGWFKNVGISITPPDGQKVALTQSIPLIQSNSIDIVGEYPPDFISGLNNLTNGRFIGLSDLFQGFAILAAPSLHAKTVIQIMHEGYSFKTAMVKAMDQIKGQTLVLPPETDNRSFVDLVFSLGHLNMAKDTHVIVTPDANGLELATNGTAKVESPNGAPFVAQYEADGWTPIVTPLELLDNLPGGTNSPSESLVGAPGIVAAYPWAKANPFTVLRFVSVMFRLIHNINHNPNKYLALELPFLNAFAGTNLTLNELKFNINRLDPLTGFSQQASYCSDTASTLYYKTWFEADVQANVKSHTIPGPVNNYNVNSLIWACGVYNALNHYKQAYLRLLSSVSKNTSLSGSQKALLTKANKLYQGYDFLDAYRIIKSVS